MSNTKREPLLSDEFMENHADKWNEGVRGITIQHRTCLLQGADWAREHYEAARVKDAELIQQMLDVLRKSLDPLAFAYQQARLPITQHEFRKTYKLANDILNAAEAAGFKPSDE